MYEKKFRGWVGKIIELGRKLGGGNLEKETHENRVMIIFRLTTK